MICPWSPIATMAPMYGGRVGIVDNYRTFAPGVDVCNQLCLQHRKERRFPKWWKALNGMLLRMGTANAFT